MTEIFSPSRPCLSQKEDWIHAKALRREGVLGCDRSGIICRRLGSRGIGCRRNYNSWSVDVPLALGSFAALVLVVSNSNNRLHARICEVSDATLHAHWSDLAWRYSLACLAVRPSRLVGCCYAYGFRRMNNLGCQFSLRTFAPSREPNPFFDSREAAKTRRGFGLRRLWHSLPVETI